ncbi:Disulfide bond formation protein B [Pseudovibrio axinellae]|uniref:Disulfide bond formation protein B n=1 Tax=Pseudovibrio axinellae TaxID=989403 RepID=A0A165WYV3_9HYPH|nr:disulfide bond formation protein B [Pseudovibrio axinellae]KZL17050.1 Disulfide bond formation protein B [Pseudovibrio axinellae]SEQ17681.1 Disulfide bond formation protein DsbB [Pseudovibrio axinellae]
MVGRIFALLLKDPLTSGAALVTLGSLTAISMAWGFEIFGGFKPCPLCLLQRNPYYAGVALGLLALGFAQTEKLRWVAVLAMLAAAGGFLYGGGVGFYQAGAEWELWLGPNDCAAGGSMELGSAANMLQSLATTKVVSCSVAQFRLFGLSFAGLNVIYSTAMVFVTLCGVVLRRQK